MRDRDTTMELPIVQLKPREERRLRNGHCWVFSNEIASVEGDVAIGDLVSLVSATGDRLGRAIYNPHSLIAARLTTRGEEPLDIDWFRMRIARALRLRQQLYPGAVTYRLIHSESDGVPGVVVDRYDRVLSVQIASAGMDIRCETLYDALMELDGIDGIVERNDTSSRTLEGLPIRVGVVRGTADVQTVNDGHLSFRVDPLGGQKTGLYLDQRENHIAMRRYASGGSVLDLFCNQGGFALHAVDAGASRVVAVDSSQQAIADLEANAALNGLTPPETHVADVFATIKELRASSERFDLVIVDPPPFAKSRKNITAARRKYVELFSGALGLLSTEGTAFLVTCSHHITRETFGEIVRESLYRARCSGIILEERGAASDHPVHPLMPETRYLQGTIITN